MQLPDARPSGRGEAKKSVSLSLSLSRRSSMCERASECSCAYPARVLYPCVAARAPSLSPARAGATERPTSGGGEPSPAAPTAHPRETASAADGGALASPLSLLRPLAPLDRRRGRGRARLLSLPPPPLSFIPPSPLSISYVFLCVPQLAGRPPLVAAVRRPSMEARSAHSIGSSQRSEH